MKSKLIVSLVVVALLAAFAPPQAHSQAIFGSIIGTTTDSSGAAVPGAKVTVVDVDKGTRVDAVSNETGNYTVTHLIPGAYNVRVEAPNFKSFEAKDVRVFADQAQQVNAQLQVGGAAEIIEVTAADVAILKTDRADVSTTFTEREVKDLPLINRNFTELQLFTPGTQTLTWQHASSENPQSSTQIFVNGQHFSGTSYQLDGTDNRDPILGIIVINPNLDSVTEAKVATQDYDAEFGQAIAAVITAQTKSGGNNVHGTAFWFRRNDELQARDPFLESTKNALTGKYKPDALRNQFGGSIGGPIIKNKWFIFGDYQGTREKVGRTVKVTVPSALVRSTCLAGGAGNCNFSEYLPNFQLFDPATGANGSGRTAFAGNLIPVGRLSAPAVKLLSLLPAPTLPGIKDNYVGSGNGGFDSNGFDIRSDYNATEKLHFFGRYSTQQFNLTGKGIFDTATVAVGGRGLGTNGFAGASKTRNQSLATGFDYTVSDRWFTDFRLGWFKYHVNVLPNGVGTKPAADAGIPGLNLDALYTSGMPAFFINGGSTGDAEFGYALSDRLTRCNCPLTQIEDQFQFVNNWTHIAGNHNVKFGADIRYARNLRVPSDQHRAGELSFSNGGSGDANVANSGVALASFLLGQVNNIHRYVSNSTDAGERQKRWFFYGQDTWRITPRVTFNYGLRWEIYFPQTVTGKDKGGFLDLDTGKIRVAGEDGWGMDFKVQKSLTNLAPRLGLAFQMTPRTVVRMGYGRSYDIGVFGSTFGHSVTQNLPVLATQQLSASNDFGTAFQLATGPPAPVFPAPDANGLITLPDGIFQRALLKKQRLPSVDAWNLTVQHQFTNTLSAEIAYVGNKGTHGFAGNGPTYNINQATVVGFVPGRNTNAAKLFFPKYGWTQGIDYFGNDASNNYHGLQTKVEKRFANGYQFLAHYTWSQAMNYDGDYYPIDPKVNHGPNDLNRRHVFVFTNLVELPFGRGHMFANNLNRVANAIIGGWQFNTVTNWSGGLPFSPSYSECGQDRDTGPCRPSTAGAFSVGAGAFNPVGHYVPYFTPVAPLATNGATSGAYKRPAVGTFGTAGRNSLRGPHLFNTDLTVFKKVSVTERTSVEFRTEAYNVFNHRNNGTPGIFFSAFGYGGSNCIDCSDGGRIQALGAPMRQVQFGLRVNF